MRTPGMQPSRGSARVRRGPIPPNTTTRADRHSPSVALGPVATSTALHQTPPPPLEALEDGASGRLPSAQLSSSAIRRCA